jgi:tRNA threonylcarbamoyladenosine modification (KEOPS) complex  Pcc1 subunit
LEATIKLEYSNPKTADAIADAVSPDNFKTPTGLTIKTERKNSQVVTEMKAEGKLSTFIATIDDLLFCVSTAEKTLHIVTKASLKK